MCVDVLCVQEICNQTRTIKPGGYKLAMELDSKEDPYICFYVRNGIPFSVEFHSSLMATLTIKTRMGSIHIHNIYNRPEHWIPIEAMIEVSTHGAGLHLTLGDLNLHHKDWDGHLYRKRPSTMATQLVDAMEDANFVLLSKKGVYTYERVCKNMSTTHVNDIVWGSEELERLVDSKPYDLNTVESDHRSVLTTVKIPVQREVRAQRCWARADHKKVFEMVEQGVKSIGTPCFDSDEKAEETWTEFATTLQRVEDIIPTKRPHPKADPCITPDNRALITAKRRAQRAWRNNRHLLVLKEDFRRCQRELQHALRCERRRWWREKVGNASAEGKTPWQLVKTAKFLRKDPSPVPMPDIVVGDTTYSEDESKAQALVNAIWSDKRTHPAPEDANSGLESGLAARNDDDTTSSEYSEDRNDGDDDDDNDPGSDDFPPSDYENDDDDESDDELDTYHEQSVEDIVNSALDHAARTTDRNDLTESAAFHTASTIPPPTDSTAGAGEDPFKEISVFEVEWILKRLRKGRAIGSDRISNEILKLCYKVLAPCLAHLINASLRLGYFPKIFKNAMTVLLPKRSTPDEKRNYSSPSDWRPIALLSCLGKVFEAVVAERMKELVVSRSLLHQSQTGFVGKSSAHALDYILNVIRSGWKKRLVVSVLKLDIKSAYDSVQPPMLMDRLRSQRLPPWILNFIQSWLTDRTTQLRMPWYESKLYPVKCGVPQGSPLSPVLFLLFASPLLDVIESMEHTYGVAYADDTYILVVSRSAKENCRLLKEAQDRCSDWVYANGMAFNPRKYELVHFDRTRDHDHSVPCPSANHEHVESCTREPKNFPNIPGMPKSALRCVVDVLGVKVDCKLTWKAHARKVGCDVIQHLIMS